MDTTQETLEVFAACQIKNGRILGSSNGRMNFDQTYTILKNHSAELWSFSMVQSRGIGRRFGRSRDVTVVVYRSRISRYGK